MVRKGHLELHRQPRGSSRQSTVRERHLAAPHIRTTRKEDEYHDREPFSSFVRHRATFGDQH